MVSFQPNDWDEDNPYLIIELKGFHFVQHARTCEDCASFLNGLTNKSYDWGVGYLGKIRRLDLSKLGRNFYDNQLTYVISDFDNGTKMKLLIDTDTIEGLEQSLKVYEELEDFETCCIIRDKMESFSS